MNILKNKELHFRVSEEFYELYENICKELNCSKTKYFIERAISPDYVYIKPGYEKENEAWKVITRIDHNMNQLARAMNQLVLFMKEKNNVDMMLHEDYAKMAEHFKFMQKEVKQLLDLQKDQYQNLFQIINRRELLECVIDYLEKNDSDYMEVLSKRVNNI